MKEVTLNKNGKISLICLVCVLFGQPLMLALTKIGISPLSAIVLTVPLFVLSIFFGIKQLKQTKFPLLWIIPSFIYCLLIIIALCLDVLDITTPTPQPKRKIGVALNDTANGQIQIMAVYYNSPAEKAGLKNGDILIKVENTSLDNKTTENVIKLIRTSEDDPLIVEVLRNGKKEILKVSKEEN